MLFGNKKYTNDKLSCQTTHVLSGDDCPGTNRYVVRALILVRAPAARPCTRYARCAPAKYRKINQDYIYLIATQCQIYFTDGGSL